MILALSLPGPAAGDALCDDLWLASAATRVAMGECLDDPRTEAVFGVYACRSDPTAPKPGDAARLDRIGAWAAEMGCDLDAMTGPLDLRDLTPRLALDTQPIRIDTEHACIGWLGPDLPLRAGPEDTARQIGTLSKGDAFALLYMPEAGGWEYVEIGGGGPGLLAAGWVRLPDPVGEMCEMAAG